MASAVRLTVGGGGRGECRTASRRKLAGRRSERSLRLSALACMQCFSLSVASSRGIAQRAMAALRIRVGRTGHRKNSKGGTNTSICTCGKRKTTPAIRRLRLQQRSQRRTEGNGGEVGPHALYPSVLLSYTLAHTCTITRKGNTRIHNETLRRRNKVCVAWGCVHDKHADRGCRQPTLSPTGAHARAHA